MLTRVAQQLRALFLANRDTLWNALERLAQDGAGRRPVVRDRGYQALSGPFDDDALTLFEGYLLDLVPGDPIRLARRSLWRRPRRRPARAPRPSSP